MLQLIIEEERQCKLTKGIKESQEVLGALVFRMSHELLGAFLKEAKSLGRAHCRSQSNANIFQEPYKYVSSQMRNRVYLHFPNSV
jgi:hypothetical protein